jgi:L-fucose mutarotase/ribose pyranase (RbsD/FucU family)
MHSCHYTNLIRREIVRAETPKIRPHVVFEKFDFFRRLKQLEVILYRGEPSVFTERCAR